MYESTDAVTTSYYPPHDSSALADSHNSRPFNPVHSQSVDQVYYDSNQRPPIMSSCAQQERLANHGSFDQSGLSPRGQPSEPVRVTDTYGHLARVGYDAASMSQRSTSGHPGHLSLDKRNCSVFSLQNERYKLDAPSYKDHDNEDDFLIHSNNNSLCLCVFDGHDGSKAVKFVQKYMKANIFGTKSWVTLSEFNRHEEIESALAEFIKVTDKDFFKNIRGFIDEKLYLQSQIPKVCNWLISCCQEFIIRP